MDRDRRRRGRRIRGQLIVTAAIAAIAAVYSSHAQEAHEFWLNEWNRDRAPASTPPAETREPGARITVTPRREYSQGGRPYCVRTCDGYYFPVPAQRRNLEEASALCGALCPAAPTDVYERRGGADASMAEATNRKGKSYSALATAFAHRQTRSSDCTCRSATAKAMTLAEDPTLKSGDIVVTAKGVRVFRGAGRIPHRERDFVDYRQDKSISGGVRVLLDALDRPYRLRHATAAAAAASSAAGPAAHAPNDSGRARKGHAVQRNAISVRSHD